MKAETTAAPWLTLKLDLPTHQASQLLTDAQSQPGAAIFSGGGEIGLLKRAEELRLLGGRDADAAVLHTEAKLHPAVFQGNAADFQLNRAAFGKFQSIAQQVIEHLLQM